MKKLTLFIILLTSISLMSCNNTVDQNAAPSKGDQVAIIQTTEGDIKVRLFPTIVPETVKNFVELSNEGKYENVPFHRVIENFMIQTGDFTRRNGTGGYSYKGPGTEIDDEFSPLLRNKYGTVSMANAGPNTNGSQFFIVTNKQGTPHLDDVHSVFGQVYEGMDVAEKISKVDTDRMDRPVNEILIKNIEITTYDNN